MQKTNSFEALKKWILQPSVIIPTLLAFVTFLFYKSSLWYGFVFDDLPTIVEYFYVRVFNPAEQFFANSRWVSRILNQFTYRYWQTEPFAYRSFNLFMHITIGLMIFALVSMVFKDLKKNDFLQRNAYLLATLVSALFLLHPVQTQTATYVTQMRLEGLVVLFTFAVLLTFTLAVKAKTQAAQIGWYVLSYVLLAFGVGTKEAIVVLPVLIALFDWFFLAEGDWQQFVSRWYIHGMYFLVMLGLLVKFNIIKTNYLASVTVTPLANNRGNVLTEAVTERITLFPYFISQFKIILHYIKIFFWPFGLCFDYDVRISKSIFSLDVVVPFIILLSMIGAAVRLWWQDKTNVISFCVAWFFVGIALRASIFPSTELVCDYKTYLSSFGVLLLIAVGLAHLVKMATSSLTKEKMHQYSIGMVSVFVLLMGYATQTRNLVWSSELAFWQDASEKSGKARCFNNLGTSLYTVGRATEAIEAFNTAINRDGWYAEPHINLGSIYQNLGDNDKAFENYRRAIEIGEGHPELFNNLGILHYTTNNLEAAELCFKQALQLRPYYSRANISLGKIYQQQNRMTEAAEAFEAALRGDYSDQDVQYLCATSFYSIGNYQRTAELLEPLDKNYQDVAVLLGGAYYSLGDFSRAAQNFGHAFKRSNSDIGLCYNYAQALINSKNYEEALAMFKLCDEKDAENYPYAKLHVAKCLHELGNRIEAVSELKQLVANTKHEHIKQDGLNLMKELGFA